jgi:hypothetical protein
MVPMNPFLIPSLALLKTHWFLHFYDEHYTCINPDGNSGVTRVQNSQKIKR